MVTLSNRSEQNCSQLWFHDFFFLTFHLLSWYLFFGSPELRLRKLCVVASRVIGDVVSS